MTLIYAFLFSFTACYFFAVIYDAPKKLFFAAGLAGASGYLISFILNDLLQIDSIYSSLLGSLTLGVMSHIMSPVVIFMIPGIIPLVPGSLAYKAMQQLVSLNFTEANNTFIRTILIAGSIALGLLLSDQLSKTLNIKKYWKVKRNRL